MFGGNFGNSVSSNGGGNTAQSIAGQDLEEIVTEHLALQAAEITSGDRLKLFPQPWPSDKLPPPTASLLSIASKKGLVAAAGPDSLVVASTDKLRAAYISRRKKKGDGSGVAEDEPQIKLHESEAKLQVPRVSHVTFNSDETCLVIAAEEGGGLAIYDTNAITKGGHEPAFQLSTNGTSVRHLLPNPNPDPNLAYFFGIVLSNGQFLLADLKARKLVNNASGSPVFHENVVCAAWSKLGKQVIAGLENGSAVQIDPQGAIKGTIPQPPQLDGIRRAQYETARALPISSIAWLSTYEFLLIYTPFHGPPGDDYQPKDSVYFIAQRQKDQPYTFHRLTSDPCAAFVESRTPAHFFISRLNDWKPSLSDALIVASSAAIDVGIFANFKENGRFVTAAIKDEGRKATLPLSYTDNSSDTTPVGVALDFSVQELAPRPIPTESDVVPDSRAPLPALCMLNTDGVLSLWWVVYDDAIRQTQPYSAMTKASGPHRTYDYYSSENGQAVGGVQQSQPTPSGFGAPAAISQTQPTSTASPFGSFGSGAPATPQAVKPAFGQPAFGAPSAVGSSFGGASGLGKQASVWGSPSPATPATNAPAFGQSTFGSSTPASTTPAFGKPAFGQPAFGKPAFGQPAFGQPSVPASAQGPSVPAFGQSTFGSVASQTGSAFGQASGLGAKKSSPWGSASAQTTANAAPGALPVFGSSSSFGAASTGVTASPFAAAAKALGSDGKTSSPFGSASQTSPFAAAGQNKLSTFGTGAPVGQATTFGTPSKPNPSPFAQQKPSMPTEASMGSTATLGSTGSSFSFGKPSGTDSLFSKPSLSKEETMEEDSPTTTKPAEQTPSAASGSGSLSGGFKLGTTFKGDGTAKDDLIKPASAGESLFGSSFGNALGAAAANKSEPPKAASPSFGFVKKEPGTEEDVSLRNIPEAPKAQPQASTPAAKADVPADPPLPPDPSTYKAAKLPDDLPLPPDPSRYKAAPLPDDLPLPPDPFSQKPAQGLPLSSAAPIVGSPPIDLGKESLVQEISKKDATEDSTWDDEDGFEDEDEGEDEDEENEDDDDEEDEDDEEEDEEGEEGEEEDDDEDGKPYQAKNPAALAAFMRRVTPASPKATSPQDDSTTPQSTLKVSYTPAGMPRTIPKGPTFPPPATRPQLSPRSPSPQRAVTNPVSGKDFSMNPVHSQMKASAVPPARPIERKEVAVPKPKEPSAGELQDEEDDRIKAILAAPVEPITTLQSFLTHQEHTGAIKTTGIPAQIEKVFRDINAMVDVAGLNARHIGAFVQGHKTLSHPGDRTIDDLEDADAWVLEDLKDMPKILSEMDNQLSEGMLQRPEAIIADAKTHENDLVRLRNRTSEMRKFIAVHTDAEHLAAQEAAPLNAETQAQQAELRQRVQSVQKLLAEVEEKMSLLRAELASAASRSADKTSSSQANVPTVEAVMNTILKMTAMVEQHSGDVDVLESQIRRLPQGLASLKLTDGGDYEDSLVSKMRSSRFNTHGSPSATPPRRTVRMAANGDPLGMSGMFGLSSSRFRTPPSASMLGKSGAGSAIFSPGAPESARKKMGDVTQEEVLEWQRRKERRSAVLKALKERVLDRETRVVRL
ncbi:uncharacterized protein K489DRAFT_364434 [Dissoconium aciculare CBS 342.82]|uniref:Nucleoporin Nup159/Nup146 N-terminal domain-containing protein n=1 Tax=Dissoconium aciculare CBS 342.82 TaxID=1314786 RepID=A0A6J3LSE4_9PEZI|nr:uncharacterized protein K489DRAFT_364434 [Dissoconium aciculare CBS 342.82]KAF1818720.1 hypothetical protein K489DRAFT_364434 [Dissoconium aciculare CBS 342.82]